MKIKAVVVLALTIAVPAVLSAASRPTNPNQQRRPDITNRKGGLTIGGAVGGAGGHFVTWGATIALTEADSFTQSNGTCAFNISYMANEIAGFPTSPAFLNRFKVDDTSVVSQQTGQSLTAMETKVINTQAYLPAGGHKLVLFLDGDGNVSEVSESNNNFQINYKLSCGKP
jgi:hypothetical protein